MEKFKLTRPIKDFQDNDITELNIKSDEDVSALDFYDMKVEYDEQTGKSKETLGSMEDPIANIAGITTSQVRTLHPKDFIALSAIVGKYLE